MRVMKDDEEESDEIPSIVNGSNERRVVREKSVS
jgi:hypothetical protein